MRLVKMVTECCKARSVVSENSEWCTACGTEIRSHVQWVAGYNNPNMYRARYPVYCRTKRFKNFILDMKNRVIYCNYNSIMDVFGLLEFHWGIHGSKSRKYFFNKACVLYYIVSKLGLELEVRTLKDQERVNIQLAEMEQLVC